MRWCDGLRVLEVFYSVMRLLHPNCVGDPTFGRRGAMTVSDRLFLNAYAILLRMLSQASEDEAQ